MMLGGMLYFVGAIIVGAIAAFSLVVIEKVATTVEKKLDSDDWVAVFVLSAIIGLFWPASIMIAVIAGAFLGITQLIDNGSTTVARAIKHKRFPKIKKFIVGDE